SGLIIGGTVGENTSMSRAEKISLLEVAKDAARGRVPVISGVAEYTAAQGAEYAREARRVGIDGLMVMPAMVYSAKPRETLDRFIPFCGLDDVLLECVALGCVGWVSGLSNVFPREGETLFRLAAAGRYAEAMSLYEWFMPLLHLDARSDLVQAIKHCEKLLG